MTTATTGGDEDCEDRSDPSVDAGRNAHMKRTGFTLSLSLSQRKLNKASKRMNCDLFSDLDPNSW